MTSQKSPANKPSPFELLEEITQQGTAKTYQFEDYLEVIDQMHKKDFSYAKIADFLTQRLGYSVTRGQVYRAYNQWLELKEMEEEKAELERLAADFDEPDFDPEEDQENQKLNEAAATVLKFILDKYPAGSVPGDALGIAKRIVIYLDEDARADFQAGESDKQNRGGR
jgi:hypothetical protein